MFANVLQTIARKDGGEPERPNEIPPARRTVGMKRAPTTRHMAMVMEKIFKQGQLLVGDCCNCPGYRVAA
jgi:hypothetical protein